VRRLTYELVHRAPLVSRTGAARALSAALPAPPPALSLHVGTPICSVMNDYVLKPLRDFGTGVLEVVAHHDGDTHE